ncbi:hypothetical protein ACRJ4W_19900 [Streptomyces sp. GLT-R25]
MRTAHLRRLLVGLTLFATAAVGVTSCGDKYGDAGTHDPARAAERARQVSDAWEGSAAARVWREGYFPLGDPVQLPEGAFHSDADKQAYQSQNLEIRGSLPGAPPKKGEVRWRGGGSLAVPVVSARAAYEQIGRGSGAARSGAPAHRDRCAARGDGDPDQPGVGHGPRLALHDQGLRHAAQARRGRRLEAPEAPGQAPTGPDG